MDRKTFEKPQKDNPHQLTVDQHVFPRRSIERFIDEADKVCVYLKSKKASFRVAPKDEIFCAKRTWNQRAESGWMRDIENKFQEVAELVISSSIQEIGPEETKKIKDFWILWHLRAEYKNNPLPDVRLNGIAGDPAINKDQQELLEKLHVGCIRCDGTIPGRDIAGDQMQLRLFAARKQSGEEEWGIIRAHEGEFIAPDIFLKNSKTVPIIPLTPTCCLMSLNQNSTVTLEVVQRINRLAIEYSQEFYFARDFSKCPL